MARVGFALGYGKFTNSREMAELMREAEERGNSRTTRSAVGGAVEYAITEERRGRMRSSIVMRGGVEN